MRNLNKAILGVVLLFPVTGCSSKQAWFTYQTDFLGQRSRATGQMHDVSSQREPLSLEWGKEEGYDPSLERAYIRAAKSHLRPRSFQKIFHLK